jgi:hypothetical protein
MLGKEMQSTFDGIEDKNATPSFKRLTENAIAPMWG